MPAITYTLSTSGLPASADLLGAIQEIELEEHARLASMLRLRLAVDVRQDGSGWSLIDDDLFTPLANLSLQLTVGASLPGLLLDAYVVDLHADFSNRPGQSSFEVVGMDGTVKMNLEQKVRSWPNMADSDIASLIFSEYGLLPDVESTSLTRMEQDLTTIQRSTDIEFLRFLAHRNGYDCYLENDPLTTLASGHFHKRRLQSLPQGALTVNMGQATNVTRFQIHYDVLEPAQVQAFGVQSSSASDQSTSVSSESHTALGSASLASTAAQRQIRIFQSGLSDTNELQAYAQATVDRSSWAITAEGELDTLAYGDILRTNRTVLVRGVGQQYSGTYFVERVLHYIRGDSYTQKFTLRRNALGLQGSEPFALS